ncbi:molybdenum cofactor cytidylyltransferase [Solimonas aquatica]|uniref:Molybdenum cofactor cytidylyltransferase n=1 Tax=Solimonas aquatica TaxID=489703 RepID=A0A1H9JAC1_9GAMM|nr:nucleotidyltransferase family protein [Solimonas aquatica]SEQ83727.1 molybdenum cofactor cytidylyltransferase [Solimonas aquatica]
MNPRIHTLLLAAGQASRFGAPKQLLQLDGQSLVRRAAGAALAAGTQLTVITGAHAEAVEAELHDLPLRLLRNPQWQHGMGSSLALGAQSLLGDSSLDAVLITLADQALVDAQALRALLSAHQADPQQIIAADHGETLGPPCLFPARFLAELAALRGDRGARTLLQQHHDSLIRIVMPQAAIDIDTPQDWQRLQEKQ